MPQLRDSSQSYDFSAAERSADTSFERIFGIETEYGVSVTGDEHTVDAAHAAAVMFEPVVTQSRSTNTYTDNGSRLYLDVGAHPEYATAEARTVRDAVLLDAAGEKLMASLAHHAQSQLRERTGHTQLKVHVYKNNTDSQGHSFGCHENYLVRRSVSLELLEHCFIPFLTTRLIFAGAGAVRGSDFLISQRSDFLDDTISSATTRSRPMINTRDEPHADSRMYRRLHVIVGDSNRSERANWMKLMTAHLVLCMIEASTRGEDYGLEALAMSTPGAQMKAISRDTNFSYRVPLKDGRALTAIDIQREYCQAAQCFMRNHNNDLSQDMRDDAYACLELWEDTLNSLEHKSFQHLASWVDWIAKYELIEALRERGADNARVQQIDFAYHDIAQDRVFAALRMHGKMNSLFSAQQIHDALTSAPGDTRAALRSRFIRAARSTSMRWSADWTSVSITPSRESHTLSAYILDPFSTHADEQFAAVMAAIQQGRDDNPILPLI
ncbi:proteasome accessory factor PafA2 family protein [Alloscardovia omnicolens]|uniref:proteasome accessory factor PafA2 family protein n=1 Tax=Alloscardovia omnicolens TaxID=419015 RepID=UPI003A63231D